jgi:hypothetical protein
MSLLKTGAGGRTRSGKSCGAFKRLRFPYVTSSVYLASSHPLLRLPIASPRNKRWTKLCKFGCHDNSDMTQELVLVRFGSNSLSRTPWSTVSQSKRHVKWRGSSACSRWIIRLIELLKVCFVLTNGDTGWYLQSAITGITDTAVSIDSDWGVSSWPWPFFTLGKASRPLLKYWNVPV